MYIDHESLYNIAKANPQYFSIIYVFYLNFENYTSLLRHLFQIQHQTQSY